VSCPTCAAQLPTVVWKVVAAFLAAPFAIAAVVFACVRRAERAELAPSSDEAPPAGRR
jgi:hypothetical protein